jgi:hypothetical protein
LISVRSVIALAPWPVRRLFPLLATIGLLAVGMISTTWWGAHLVDKTSWQLPHDLWGTMLAGRRLLHLDPGGLYTQPTGLVSLPGAALILVPIVALIDAAGVGLGVPNAQNTHPTAWLFAGPYEIALSAMALVAADSLAERLGVARPKRALLAAASAVALWSVSVRWGHPEDAVAVALFLFGIGALADLRVGFSAWLVGAAICVQPLVLLAVPVLLVTIEPRRLVGYLGRAAAPSALLLGVAASANWSATFDAVTSQPNWPATDHATPWTSLAPHLSGGAVAAGPARVVVIFLAVCCALVVQRRWHAPRDAAWSPEALEELLWWVAATLALRCVFEPVMTPYYLWPVLAVALIAASRNWTRLVATSLVASVLTFVSQAAWHGPWLWWGSVVAGLGLTLVFARNWGPKKGPRRHHLAAGARSPQVAAISVQPRRGAAPHGSHET